VFELSDLVEPYDDVASRNHREIGNGGLLFRYRR